MMPINMEPLGPDYQDHIWRQWRARELKLELYEETLSKIVNQSVDNWSVNMAVSTLHRGKTIMGPGTERTRRESWIAKSIEAVVRAVRDGFRDDPGTSDLDNEQSVTVRMELGVWRKARAVVMELDRGVGKAVGNGGKA